MTRVLLVLGWVCVMAAGIFLRFEDLAKRPFHADEATGARITAMRLESGGGRFDPKHYHGPVLHILGGAASGIRGEHGWKSMSKGTLRLVPAVSGVLLLLVPLWWRHRCGDGPALAAAAFLATSPLLVYYSRMFIHEPLLVLFGMAAVMTFVAKPRLAIPGILIGLMFATKESFAISMLAWTGAALLLALENRRVLAEAISRGGWRGYVRPVVLSGLAALLVSMAFYTDFLRHPEGAVDAVRTFFVYETVGGHDKSAAYYLELLGLPRKAAGMWWFGTPVLLLALLACAGTFFRQENKRLIRFVAYSAAGHFLIYSLFAYKTPWLACLPWALVCLLAGLSFAGFAARPRIWQAALVLLSAVALASQFQQARRASGRLASDGRNPFAYVPTRPDVETLAPWLADLATLAPDGSLEPIAVVGRDYWPLPWYLRQFDRIGYWPAPEGKLAAMPLVFALPEAAEETARLLETTHMPLPRGLRAEVPLHLFVRNDIWNRWMNHD